MHTFISDTIKLPTAKQKNILNIKYIIATIPPADRLYSGTHNSSFWTGSCPESWNNGLNIDEFKHHILTTYRVSPKHTEPVSCYHLERISDYGYALYKRRGRYMHLVNTIPFIKPKK
ncbi:hypothetical protein [Xenorhabdus innexi]|uniref:Uncharacterized protein n=1 Tax=Xenorhabdus innexi TaxID=290109 RepID=A0A1N6MUA2_9GAMM|nr:hypothetical protein [Xenorhabdus innexi]PHM33567.1 hypothetical protein Xinn_02300 [Xenorhabdus innexi]SIP72367.1 conserved hypothetical protein [Xenorhabdus innexi]